MSSTSRVGGARVLGPLLLCITPVAVLYTLLARTIPAVPILDDYDSILAFATWLSRTGGLRHRLLGMVAFQHSEYKLMLENAINALVYAVTGHVDLLLLVTIGNLFVLALLAVLWLYFPKDIAFNRQLLVFAPACLLLGNLRYAETLNWATGVLQNLPVLVFALLALWLCSREGVAAIVLSALALVLAIASSGNGFFVVPAALSCLLGRRDWARIGAWLAITATMVGAYLYRYRLSPSLEPTSHHPWRARLLFPLKFLGGAGGGAPGALLLGAVLIGVFVIAWRLGYARRQPAWWAAVLFLLITAVGVAVSRGGQPLLAPVSSRYRIYSCLALILVWRFLLDLLRERAPRHLARLTALAILVSALFAAYCDVSGYRFLVVRRSASIAQYEALRDGVVPQDPPVLRGFFHGAVQRLVAARSAGVYEDRDAHLDK